MSKKTLEKPTLAHFSKNIRDFGGFRYNRGYHFSPPMFLRLLALSLGLLLIALGFFVRTKPELIAPTPSATQTPIVSQKVWDIAESTGGTLFYESARKQIGVVTEYDHANGYYAGGEPPPYTGVCTDVISRAFSGVSVDFRSLVHSDILKYPTLYPAAGDRNIDYRRVKNLKIFLDRKATVLPNELTPDNRTSYEQWQTGDIVIFDELPVSHLWHIGIVAHERRDDGIPYIIDNHGYGTSIVITPLDWPTQVIGHYRWKW